jgi:hypothetical protein
VPYFNAHGLYIAAPCEERHEVTAPFQRGASRPKRVHTSKGRSLAGKSLAAETGISRDEESRLKAGCSQDWLPHKSQKGV